MGVGPGGGRQVVPGHCLGSGRRTRHLRLSNARRKISRTPHDLERGQIPREGSLGECRTHCRAGGVGIPGINQV